MPDAARFNGAKGPEIVPYQEAGHLERYHVITTIVMPILLIVAGGLALHYGLHPGIGKMIPITHNFSMTLPLLVTSSLGGASAIFLLVELALHKQVKRSYEKAFGTIFYSKAVLRELVRMGLQPNGRSDLISVEEYRDWHGNMEGYDLVDFKTQDDVKLGGFWREQVDSDDAPPAVILFHGNGMNAEDMRPWMDYYWDLGFSVLSMEYRGYGISDGETGGDNAEMEAYMDAEAALKFVMDKKIDLTNILAHGYSLGGAYAASLGGFFGVQTVLSHTFTSYADVMEHLFPVVTTGSIMEAVEATYRQGERDSMIADVKLKTDGWNSFEKLQKDTNSSSIQPELFIIEGEKDEIMSDKFGSTLHAGRYTDRAEQHKYRKVTVAGGHCNATNFLDDTRAKDSHFTFLQEIGLL
ncbi:MAG: Multifunctional-autoprocessing repeats-in-toxin [Chlamydiae bacterium]|nr:Multifunctional-autoprocessing repeats-in-toxin [Chlamydiota bacterium]